MDNKREMSDSHDWLEIPSKHVCQSLNREMHGALSSDKYRSLPLSFTFCDGLANSHNGTCGISNTSINGLVKHHHTAGKFGVAKAKGRGAGFTDNDITRAEKRAEGLRLLV
jgi:hypothetical protein